MHPDSDLSRHGRELRTMAARLHALRAELHALWEERGACGEPGRVADLTRRYLLCQVEWDREYAAFQNVYDSWNRCCRAVVHRSRAAACF